MSDLKSLLKSRLDSLKDPHLSQQGGEGFFMDGVKGETQQAAVLVPCIRSEEPAVILTVRSHQMPHHAGQVALPGGRPNVGEPFPMVTALREAEEEIGLKPTEVEILGCLPPIDTLTGFRITPVVGWIERDPSLTPCDREVQSLFRLPLRHVLAADGYCRHRLSIQAQSQTQAHWVWSLRGHHWPIWGATAHILASLAGLSGRAPQG